ncbi:Mif2/CENP-C like-domain-containing protein [Echria macrotheca]|uniref:CENP-C homolog n=1 Tax=Echria macrotheca TaxID=438768 RepID=A0AAJ0B9H4_9PEZI|nr:Mif2/CENP-C like-domain-containing protein [Echria macrotheca]
MTRSATTQSSVTRPDDAEAVDDTIVFKPDVALQLNSFRQKFNVCTTDEQLSLCVQKRDELLGRYNEVDILATAYERIMSDECSAYRQLKQRRTNRKSPAEQEDDEKEWGRFSGAATRGSNLLPPLKEVVRCWGAEIVWHYGWPSRKQKYLDKLCAAARAVHEWEKAVVGLNRSILSRTKDLRRFPAKSINPIEPADLDHLRAWSSKDPAPVTAQDLTDAFGFDKYGLMVHKEFAVGLPESEGAGTTLVPATPEGKGADAARPPGQTPSQPDHGAVDATMPTNHNPSTPDLEEDTAPTTPEASSHFPTKMSLRARKGANYHVPPTVPVPRIKAKKARLAAPAKSPKTPSQCCPDNVPSTFLLALDDLPTFEPEAVEQLQPLLPNLCGRHLLLFAKATSAMALAQKSVPNGNQEKARTATTLSADRQRRRADSLEDTPPASKRPRVDAARPDVAGDRPVHDQTEDDTYRKRTLAELQDEDIPVESWERNRGAIDGEVVRWYPDHEFNPPAQGELVLENKQLAISAAAIATQEVKGGMFRYAKTLNEGFFNAGVVDLPPGGKKQIKNSHRMFMTFFMHTGRVLVKVNKTRFRISKGGMWFVPRGNCYSIKNDYEQPARIFFSLGCQVAPQPVEEDEEDEDEEDEDEDEDDEQELPEDEE